MGSEYGRAIEQQRAFARHFASPQGIQDFYSRHSDPMRTRMFHQATSLTLAMADPYYWNAEMSELLEGVSEDMPRWTLRREALPTDFGFCWFARPLALPGIPANVLAITWGMWRPSGADKDLRENMILGAYTNRPDGKPGIIPMMSFAWRPGDAMGVDDLDVGPATERMDRANRRVFQYIAAAFALIEQRILVTSKERPGREFRRRLARAGETKEALIHVVRLRRSSQGGAPSDGTPMEWSCRWIVRGHWRQQFYPSTGEYRPIFILPHVKGPDDKPLKAPAERVFAVVR
jgi:hypothetical protein